MTRTRRIIAASLALAAGLGLSGCVSAADQANENLSKEAERFEVLRRFVGINGITDKVLFTLEGFCSYEKEGDTFEAICLVDRESGSVERTALHLSDNVTVVVTQLESKSVDLFQPLVIFAPEQVVPNFELNTSARLQGDGNG